MRDNRRATHIVDLLIRPAVEIDTNGFSVHLEENPFVGMHSTPFAYSATRIEHPLQECHNIFLGRACEMLPGADGEVHAVSSLVNRLYCAPGGL